jgi:plasmid stabilization system protein ParE
MGLRIAPQVEAELDEIWDYHARESGNEDIANRLIDSIADRFCMLSTYPYLGRRRDPRSASRPAKSGGW